MNSLKAFGRTNFDWTMSQKGIWKDQPYDVPDVHPGVLDGVLERFDTIEFDEEAESPRGEIVVGQAGSGKTHFLGQLRREVISRGGTFLMADLTDVRDFWETTLQGVVTSLTRRLTVGGSQLQRVLDNLLHRFGEGALQGVTAAQLAEIRPPKLTTRIDELIRSMARGTNAHEMARYEAVIRSLTLLASARHDLLSLGEAWLSGLDVREEAKQVHDLPSSAGKALDRLRGIAWAVQWTSPIVVAVDQLDAIASEARAVDSTQEHGLETIFNQATNGLMGLREIMPRTLVVVACLESNWQYLESKALQSVSDRFSSPRLLKPPSGPTLARLIEKRLSTAYARLGFVPPYSTFPFRPSCFDGLQLTPRVLLQRAEFHRKRCLEAGEVTEIDHLEDITKPAAVSWSSWDSIDKDFENLKANISVHAKLKGLVDLGPMLETACIALEKEHKRPDHIDVELDLDFGQTVRIEPLHARIRVIDHSDGGRERHLSLRFIQETHHTAFQTRLTKALTESGINADLGFRRLVIFRTEPVPRGPKTKKMVDELKAKEGWLVHPPEDDVRTLGALGQMFENPPDRFHEWLAERRPVSQLSIIKPHVPFLFEGEVKEKKQASPKTPPPVVSAPPLSEPKDSSPAPIDAITLGKEIVGIGDGPHISIPSSDLARHVAILASAGSGKTVLLRRMVEEAALRGIPSIIIDGANDLSRLGEPWPEPPPQFVDGDKEAAKKYFDSTETIVWTPGGESGNPFSVDPLPDFSALLDEPDELSSAIELAFDLLASDLKLTGTSGQNQVRRAILNAAVVTYAKSGGRGLSDLLEILREPGSIVGHYNNGERHAHAVADRLAAEMQLNSMLRSEGNPLDFDELFGRNSDKTRISVINLSALPTLDRQQALVGRLMTLLFTYARRHPSKGEMAGLIAIDEAKDFVPSSGKAASSPPIKRAAAQLRKYGYGMIVATQEPKSIDNRVVSNSSTQIFGRALAAATQQAVQTMMSQLGGQPAKLGTLKPGQFFVSVPASPVPRKVQTSWCLSHHGPSPTPEDVRLLAARHRSRRHSNTTETT